MLRPDGGPGKVGARSRDVNVHLSRLCVTAVVLLSLMTPLFWVTTGLHHDAQQGKTVAEKSGRIGVHAPLAVPRPSNVQSGLAPAEAWKEPGGAEQNVTSSHRNIEQQDAGVLVETSDNNDAGTRDGRAVDVHEGRSVLQAYSIVAPTDASAVTAKLAPSASTALLGAVEGIAAAGSTMIKGEKGGKPFEKPQAPVGSAKASKLEFLVKAMKEQLGPAKQLLQLATKKDNKQLMKHLTTVTDRAQGIIDKYEKEKAWVGDEAATGVIKLLEALNARAREWKGTLALVEKLKDEVTKTKAKLLKVTRERNILDLAAAKSLPKSLHCLGMKLTMEHSNNPKVKVHVRKRLTEQQAALDDRAKFHYAIFSDNVLATSVVVNSTVVNAKEPHRHVFHLVTDSMNKGAMEAWFALHPPGLASLEIHAVEEYTWLNASYCPVMRQLASESMKNYYFGPGKDNTSAAASPPGMTPDDIKGHKQPKYRNPKYLSMLNHLRFYLPQVFPKLDRILFLDDDIVVQKDLTPLFGLPLNGSVNGAVFTCKGDFHRLHKYLNFSHPFIQKRFDPNSCGWAYGMNVFDLAAWRQKNLTEVYHEYQSKNENRDLWRLGTLPPGLMTFYNMTAGLDKSWHVLGLGYNEATPVADIKQAAVIHWNGNQKPWLDIAFKHFKEYWIKYVATNDEIVQQCNINVY